MVVPLPTVLFNETLDPAPVLDDLAIYISCYSLVTIVQIPYTITAPAIIFASGDKNKIVIPVTTSTPPSQVVRSAMRCLTQFTMLSMLNTPC